MGKRIFLFLATNLLIMVAITIVMGIVGWFFPGLSHSTYGRHVDFTGLFVFCLVWGMGGAFISLQLSRWMAKKTMGVQLVDGATGHADLDWLYSTVQRLSREAGLPMPEVGYYVSTEVNAFATGPSKSRALVAISTGLLQTMSRNEAEGVIGHELSHVANGDMVTMTLIQGVLNAFVMFFARIIGWAVGQAMQDRDNRDRGPNAMTYIVQMIVTIVAQIALGILASFVTAWFSRQREFRADAGAAQLMGRKQPMVNALARLGGLHPAELPKGLAAMGIAGGIGQLFSTHPPIEERIAALQGRA